VPAKSPLDRVRELCLSLPETSERLSHGQPSFFIREKKTFVMYLDNHHDDGRLALWLAAPEGMQEALVEAAPEHYFRPPGPRAGMGRDRRCDRGRLRDRGVQEPRRAGHSSGGSPAMTPKVAPWGSATTAKRPTPSSSCTGPSTPPPSSCTLATAASQSSTVK
jgi:hypothetical protein